MATIVLSSIGSLFGPIGQIAGALAGNAIDNALFAPGDKEGARLKELAVTGSSYGTPIAKQYGVMRVPGTIVWSTDLMEHREKHNSGKGAPDTVAYSYSVSFAVALSSRPIDRVGRIWADGNLLRGGAGDLKSGGMLRIHKGHGTQSRDPLMEAALGEHCPAFRGRAYAVFEDLDLTDFGNRIPALAFEVFAGPGSELIGAMLHDQGIGTDGTASFAELAGFSHEGGTLRDITQLVARLHPLTPRLAADGLVIGGAAAGSSPVAVLPPATAWDEGEFGRQDGHAAVRTDNRARSFAALRYYDPARDFQPGLQHAGNSDGGTQTFQFPGALSASDALALARRSDRRASIDSDTLSWRCFELDPAIEPGTLVRVPGYSGNWLVAGWEWRERGVEYDLVRHRPIADGDTLADPGLSWTAPDRAASATLLRVFETPWNGTGSSSSRSIYAAVSAPSGRWSGAALYAQRDGVLTALGSAAHERAISGELAEALEPSAALRLEPGATLRLSLHDSDARLVSTDARGLAQGDNRLLVGEEIVQFLEAEPLGGGAWELKGLVRGRGATEIEAGAGHPPATRVTLLDDRLVALGDNALAISSEDFAAIGLWDEYPAIAALENAGSSLRPPSPVHCRMVRGSDGALIFTWQRRARGQWPWLDEVAQPLVEEVEAYEIGYGPVDTPLASWNAASPMFTMLASDLATLRDAHGSRQFWVRQIGSFARSRASLLGTDS